MSSSNQPDTHLNIIEDMLAQARAAGADAADAIVVQSASLGLSCRLGAMEDLERSEASDAGLRVFIGRQQAVVSSSDLTPGGRAAMVERAVAMARHAPEDPYCGLADPSQIAAGYPADLDLFDPAEPAPEDLFEQARRTEEAALAVKGVTNSEGAGAGWSRSAIALGATNGFMGAYRSTSFSLGVSVLAGKGTAMERDYEYYSARHREDLDIAAEIGQRAGEKTVRRLNPRPQKPANVPVVYDPRVANSLLGHLAGAINGASVARGSSFLKDSLHETIFPADITIVDDPLRARGLRSKPFDGEGLATSKQTIVSGGRLATWLMDTAAARQLGMEPTGHASRGTSSVPGAAPTNLYMEAGALGPAELIEDIKGGFYVTELIGMGVNGVTGDYSRGASGFWIEDGAITYPVSNLTIAGNLRDMYQNLRAANDLAFRYGTNAPTLRIEGMTLAGT